MKRLLLATLAVVAASITVYAADMGFVSLRNINKIETGTQVIGKATGVSGHVSIRSAATCTVFLNATTLAGTQATTGLPMIANTEYKFNLPATTNLAFTCATTAAAKYVYVVR